MTGWITVCVDGFHVLALLPGRPDRGGRWLCRATQVQVSVMHTTYPPVVWVMGIVGGVGLPRHTHLQNPKESLWERSVVLVWLYT